jgi:hypothetical protein
MISAWSRRLTRGMTGRFANWLDDHLSLGSTGYQPSRAGCDVAGSAGDQGQASNLSLCFAA